MKEDIATGVADVKQKIGQAIFANDYFREKVGRGPGGREVALVHTKLEEAFLWLEMAERHLSNEADKQ